jgi:hypothetical protein
VRGLGILLHEEARHHQVARYAVDELVGQTAECLESVLVEVLCGNVVRNRRSVIDLLFGGAFGRVAGAEAAVTTIGSRSLAAVVVSAVVSIRACATAIVRTSTCVAGPTGTRT